MFSQQTHECVAQKNKQTKTSVQNKRFVMTLEKSINIRGKLY